MTLRQVKKKNRHRIGGSQLGRISREIRTDHPTLSSYFHSVEVVDPVSECRLCQAERAERMVERGWELYRGFRGIEAFGDQVCPSVHGLVRLRCCKPIIPAAASILVHPTHSPTSHTLLLQPLIDGNVACSTIGARVFDETRDPQARNRRDGLPSRLLP